MFRLRDVIIKVALEYLTNTQIALTGNDISFLTQYIQNYGLSF